MKKKSEEVIANSKLTTSVTRSGFLRTGLTISRYRKMADIEDENGQLHHCDIKPGISSLVVGDHVLWTKNQDAKDGGTVETVLERQSLLMRSDLGGTKIIAANVDRVIVVLAVVPPFSLNLTDRYLVACEIMGIKPVLVFNKIDLLSLDERERLLSSFSVYQKIGYQVLFVSQLLSKGIESLRVILSNQIAVFVGQSGVGKSSLINALLPASAQPADIGQVSNKSGFGRHTTTVAKLYHLSAGGAVIDSPGIRQFGLWDLQPDEVAKGFVEFSDYLGRCHYRDCQHRNDHGCALREAVAKGSIAESRFENYHQIVNSMAEIKRKKHHFYQSGKNNR